MSACAAESVVARVRVTRPKTAPETPASTDRMARPSQMRHDLVARILAHQEQAQVGGDHAPASLEQDPAADQEEQPRDDGRRR